MSTRRDALRWVRPSLSRPRAAPREHSPPGRWHVIAARPSGRCVLTSRSTREAAELAAECFRAGGIDAAVTVELEGSA